MILLSGRKHLIQSFFVVPVSGSPKSCQSACLWIRLVMVTYFMLSL